MGRRSDFPRVDRDLYRTFDARALPPLLEHVPVGTRYIEPCAGHGDLVDQLSGAGLVCAAASDIKPMRDGIDQADAFSVRVPEGCVTITNTPWKRPILHQMIVHFSDQAPLWALFDSNWANTKQARAYMERLRKIVVVGRLIWMPGTKMSGKEDVSWFLFDRPLPGSFPQFYGRGVSPADAGRRTRRICADCGVLIDRFGKWKLQTRNGLPTPVHRDCANPSGLRVEVPMPIMQWIERA